MGGNTSYLGQVSKVLNEHLLKIAINLVFAKTGHGHMQFGVVLSNLFARKGS